MCQSLSSLPHALTEIHQCAKDGCTLEDLSPIIERKVLQCTLNLNPLLMTSEKARKRCQETNIGTPTLYSQGEVREVDNTSTHLTSTLKPKPYSKPYEEAVDEADLNVNSKVVYSKVVVSMYYRDIASHLLVVGLRFSSYIIEGRR